MERKVVLASPHLKVQNTPYTVRSNFDGLMCNQLLKGDNTHLNGTGTFASATTRWGGALVQPGKHASVRNYTESRSEMGSVDAKLALIFKWEITSKFQW